MSGRIPFKVRSFGLYRDHVATGGGWCLGCDGLSYYSRGSKNIAHAAHTSLAVHPRGHGINIFAIRHSWSRLSDPGVTRCLMLPQVGAHNAHLLGDPTDLSTACAIRRSEQEVTY